MRLTPSCSFLTRTWSLIWALLALVIEVQPAWAQRITQARDANLQTIGAILRTPDVGIDLAKTKLTIDHMIDPNIDIATNLQQLDAMAKEVKARLPANASSRETMEALRSYIYQGGPWNNNRPFRYDLDDPFGHNIHNKLLPTYLATRKGNCVSMPFLFIILGQKLGLDVTAATAPQHIFVKYRDGIRNVSNLETTDRAGPTQDASYQRQMPMTTQALDNGIYMRALSKKETVVLMAEILMEFYGEQDRQEQRIALADLALQYFPKHVFAMLHQASAYYRLLKKNFMDKYPTPKDIPIEDRAYFNDLSRNNKLWGAKAEALGWRGVDQATNANYLQTINRARSAQ